MQHSSIKSFVKDNAIVIASHSIVYMKGIILMPIIIKAVGVTMYGGFTLLSSLLGIIFGISSFGAGFRARRFLPSSENIQKRRELFYPQFFFGLISILVFSAILVLLDKQINLYIFKNEIIYSTLIMPAYLVSYFIYAQGCDYFQYTSRVQFMTTASLCFPYLQIFLTLICIHYYNIININILVIIQVLSALIVAAPCYWVAFREMGFQFSFYSIDNLIYDIKIGFPLVLGFIVDFILAGSDRYFIAFYLSVNSVGHYNPGYVLGSLIVFIPKAMCTVIPQLLSKEMDKKNTHSAQIMIDYSIKFFLILAIPFVFGSCVLGKKVLSLLANREIAEIGYLITPIIAIGSIFYGLNMLLSNILFVKLKTKIMFKVNLYSAIFNGLANFILLYFFRNIIVAAITTLISYFIGFLYTHKSVANEWPIDYHPTAIIKSTIASLFMVILLAFISGKKYIYGDILTLVLLTVIGIVSYFIFLIGLKTFSHKEIDYLKFLLNKKVA